VILSPPIPTSVSTLAATSLFVAPATAVLQGLFQLASKGFAPLPGLSQRAASVTQTPPIPTSASTKTGAATYAAPVDAARLGQMALLVMLDLSPSLQM